MASHVLFHLLQHRPGIESNRPPHRNTNSKALSLTWEGEGWVRVER